MGEVGRQQCKWRRVKVHGAFQSEPRVVDKTVKAILK